MEHYLTQIDIKKVRHLSNVKIDLQNDKRQHLLLTGKNGSGKTSLLLAICKYLKSINNGMWVSKVHPTSNFSSLITE